MKLFCVKNRFTFWRYLTNTWSIVLYVLFILDFVNNNAFHNELAPLATLYVGSLAIYAGDKEFERWHNKNGNGRHPGELFVIVWTILIFIILMLDFALNKPYELPTEVTSAYIAILSVLAITQRSKSLYKKKKSA